MSDEDLMSQTHDCGGDAAAYVLGALEPDEAVAFRRHMNSCVVCRDEVIAFQRVADALPMAAVQHPLPRDLRRRVLAQVHEEARAASRTATRSTTRWAGRISRPALAGGLAAVIALAAIGGVELASGGSSTKVFAASVGQAELRVADGHSELIVNHLAPPRPGHIYEVWLKHVTGTPAPSGALFSVTSTGAADVDVPGSLHDVKAVMVTEEPDGGSPYPTTSAVVVTPLT